MHERIYGTKKYGFYYCYSPYNVTIDECYNEYSIDGIDKNDVVLDLGANVGGFAIRVSNKCKYVISVEPLYHEILKRNIIKNKIVNIEIIPWAVGNGKVITINYDGPTIIQTHTFEDIIDKIGYYPNFLKCDIEGGEYYINPENFAHFKRLEIEFHQNEKFGFYIDSIKKTHYIFFTHTDTHLPFGLGILHGFRKGDYSF